MDTDSSALTRRRLLATGGAISAAAVAGCLGGSTEGGELPPLLDPADYTHDRERPPDEEAAMGSRLVFTQERSRDEDFDPTKANDGYSAQVYFSVFDGLYEWDDGLELEPKVAVDFPDVERDRTRYIYEIHDGIEFHSGNELTAEDVAHSFLAPIEEETVNAVAYQMIDEVTVLDERQVQVDLAYEYGPWELATQGVLILDKEARLTDVEAYDEATTPEEKAAHVDDGFNEQPIGSGPFAWKDFQYGEYVELERNDEYWDEPVPFLETVRFETNVDDTSRISDILTGETDAIGSVPNDDWDVLDDDEDVRVHVAESPSMSYIFFNTNEGAGTADPNVRRGIAHAFSMTDYVRTNLYNTALPVVTPTSPITNELWEFPVDQWEADLYPSYDPDRAKELLDEHAPADWNPTFLVTEGNRARLAERVATRLDEIGYDMDVQTRNFTTLLEQTIYSDGDPDDYELYFLGWTGGPDPDQYIYPLFHESLAGATQGHFYEGSETFHDDIFEARRTADHDERRNLYVRLIEEILEELPALPAFSEHNTMATRKRVRDLHAHPFFQYNPRLVSEYGNVWIED